MSGYDTSALRYIGAQVKRGETLASFYSKDISAPQQAYLYAFESYSRLKLTSDSAQPPALIAQLKPNGVMVIPVGSPFKRNQVLYVYRKDAEGKVHSRRMTAVYFVPMTGDISKSKQ